VTVEGLNPSLAAGEKSSKLAKRVFATSCLTWALLAYEHWWRWAPGAVSTPTRSSIACVRSNSIYTDEKENNLIGRRKTSRKQKKRDELRVSWML
jgi:hypothetical protein